MFRGNFALKPLDNNVECGKLQDDISKDVGMELYLSEEKLLKRCRQIENGVIQVVILQGKPIMLFLGGKIERLG